MSQSHDWRMQPDIKYILNSHQIKSLNLWIQKVSVHKKKTQIIQQSITQGGKKSVKPRNLGAHVHIWMN